MTRFRRGIVIYQVHLSQFTGGALAGQNSNTWINIIEEDRLFFLRENPLSAFPFYSHLAFRGVEPDDCGTLAWSGAAFCAPRRLKEKSPATSGNFGESVKKLVESSVS